MARRPRLCLAVAVACALGLAPLAHAQDDGDTAAKPEAASTKIEARRHWDAGLDIKYTQFVEETAYLLNASWLRHWPWGLRFGASLFGLAQSVRKEEGGVKSKSTLYGATLTGEYEFFGAEGDMPAIAAGASFGKGSAVAKVEYAGQKETLITDFYVIEPYINVSIITWKHLSYGVGASMRIATPDDTDKFESDKVSGAAVFASFRHQL